MLQQTQVCITSPRHLSEVGVLDWIWGWAEIKRNADSQNEKCRYTKYIENELWKIETFSKKMDFM